MAMDCDWNVLICVPFLTMEGNVIGRNGGAGCERIIQQHQRPACLLGGTDAKVIFPFSL